MAPSAESSEMWILGKVTQLLDQGMANLGCGGRHRAPQKGAVNKGNFYKWKETNYEGSWKFFLRVSWEVFNHTVPRSQTLTTALRL